MSSEEQLKATKVAKGDLLNKDQIIARMKSLPRVSQEPHHRRKVFVWTFAYNYEELYPGLKAEWPRVVARLKKLGKEFVEHKLLVLVDFNEQESQTSILLWTLLKAGDAKIDKKKTNLDTWNGKRTSKE